MKLKKILTLNLALLVAILMTSCFEEIDFTGPMEPVSLTIVVDDGSEDASSPISNATVELYTTLDDYISEVNVVATGQTDANGKVTFDAATLGDEVTKYYFNVASGTMRNWNFNSSTDIMLKTNGATIETTSVGDLPPGFVYLTANSFILNAYSYAGTPFVLGDNVLPMCEINDIIEFKKDGSVWRFDGTTKCSPPSDYQLPLFDVDGMAWSKWGLSADGSGLNIRDFDPFWDSGDVEVDGGIQIDEAAGTVTIAYGGPYNASLTAM